MFDLNITCIISLLNDVKFNHDILELLADVVKKAFATSVLKNFQSADAAIEIISFSLSMSIISEYNGALCTFSHLSPSTVINLVGMLQLLLPIC